MRKEIQKQRNEDMRLIAFLLCAVAVIAQIEFIPVGPSAHPLPVSQPYVVQVEQLINQMTERWSAFDSQCNFKAPFCLMYLYMTYGLRDHIRDLYFDNGELMSNFTVKFAHRYFQWLDANANDGYVTPVWLDTFDYGETGQSSVYEDLFLGMNSHINFDLGNIIYELNYGAYQEDYNRVNDILAEQLGPIERGIAARYDPSINGTLDVMVSPEVLQMIEGWRQSAWTNGILLINSPQARPVTLENMSQEALTMATPYKSYNVAGLGASTTPARVAYCSAHHAPLSIS